MATEKLNIGSKAPDFNLIGIDDKYHSLNDYKESEGIVIIFFCNHCPYVQAYIERIKIIQDNFKVKGINVIAINPNDSSRYPDDSFEEMKLRAEINQFNFSYLHDETQHTAKDYGATHTPEIFLFDKNRKLVFHGKIDDNWKEPDNVNEKYLENAITEMLNGSEISVPETFTIGCTIKWKV